MEFLSISFDVNSLPVLDPDFIPLERFTRAFLKTADQPFTIAVQGIDGQQSVYHTFVHGQSEFAEADRYYADRLVKTLLWQKGGYRVLIAGSRPIYESIAASYAADGTRSFDQAFMARVYNRPFEVVYVEDAASLTEQTNARPVGRHLDGCRIGFDAGGSDRKVSAVIDGTAVFSEEVVWHPKEQSDPTYHYDGIVSAFRSAAAHLPRIDGIGVSSAGIYLNNQTRVASLFLKVPESRYEEGVKDIYIRAAKAMGPDIPLEVCNDGDVSALAGSMSLNAGCVLGLAMGTSEAGGYVDANGHITGWLNELAFIPVDANPGAMVDEWSGDIGCGVKYFSQDGVIKLAARVGILLPESSTPAEKLKIVQALMAEDDQRARQIYTSIGCYLGHSLAWYSRFYSIQHVLLLGRVMSGRGGDLILEEAQRVLSDVYPDITCVPALPDEAFRRIGQSVAAASLPIIRT